MNELPGDKYKSALLSPLAESTLVRVNERSTDDIKTTS